MQPAERLRLGPHTMSAEETTLSSTTSGGHRHVPQHPAPIMCHLRSRHRCRQHLGEPGRIRQHPGQHTPSVLCHVVAADFDPQILRPIADSPHLSGPLPPEIIEFRQRRFSLRQCTFHIHDTLPLSTTSNTEGGESASARSTTRCASAFGRIWGQIHHRNLHVGKRSVPPVLGGNPSGRREYLADGNKTGFGSDECGGQGRTKCRDRPTRVTPPGARRLQGLRVPLSIYTVELVVSVQLDTLRPSDLAAGGDGNRAGGYQNEVRHAQAV